MNRKRRPLVSIVVVITALVSVLGSVPAARASSPGAAGTLAVQRSSAYIIENDNGVTSQSSSLALQAVTGGAFATPLSCQGFDGSFGGQGEDRYCPESAPGFAPDGRTLAFSGVLYHSDGSSLPSQIGCPSTTSCPQAISLAAADGSVPRPLPLPLANAEQPQFLPGGQQLILAGALGERAPDDLYTVNIDGSGLQRLTTTGASEPAPCPNGSIAYVHGGDLYLRSAGGRMRRLTRRGGTWPDCSHDSRTLVFERGATLYTISVTGRGLRHLTAPNGRGSDCPAPISHRHHAAGPSCHARRQSRRRTRIDHAGTDTLSPRA